MLDTRADLERNGFALSGERWREAVAGAIWLFHTRQRRLMQYVLAVASMGAALSLALAAHVPLGDHVFALFISAVMVSAWNGGLGPGLLGAILGAASIDYFFEDPGYSLEIASPVTALNMLVFLFAALLISSLSNNLRVARRRAEEANRQREQFVHSITHDLKTPLTAISAFASLSRRLASGGDLPHTDRLYDNLKKIEATALRMARLVDELMDAHRLNGGHALQLQPEPVDLLELCQRKAAESMVVDPRRAVCVTTTASGLVGCWDPRRLERVLDNLLTNALKYGEAGSEIHLELARQVDHQADWALVRVRDRGPGMAPEELRHLFDPFYRGPDAVARVPGTGLGLAGVRTIVRLHGGDISVESAPDRGTTVTVRLPV